MSLKSIERRYRDSFPYNYFKRFLKKNVGQNWDDVYSELKKRFGHCQGFDDRIKWNVELDVYWNNGPKNVRGCSVRGFYVYDNILCEHCESRYKYKPHQYGIGDDVRYLRIDGVWFRLHLGPIDYRRDCLVTPIGCSEVFWRQQVLKRESLSKRDIQKLGLNQYNNDPYCNLTIYTNGYKIGNWVRKQYV